MAEKRASGQVTRKSRRHRQAEPAADRGAMDGGDDRLLVAKDPHRLDVEMVDRAEVVGGIAVCDLGGARLLLLPRRVVEIGAGAERLALRRKHRAADLDVAVELLQRVRDLVDQRDVEEVQRRPADFDGADMADLLDADIRVGGHVLISNRSGG